MAGDGRQIICTLDGVIKQYASQSVPVLNGISLSIAEGEIIGIRGENGSGKSTLLSVTGGLIRPDRGEVRYAEGVKGSIGYVPQDMSLYQDLTGFENLKFWGIAGGMPSRAIRTRSEWLLKQTGLLEKGKLRVRTYSGGMKRRLHLATALMNTPRLLLLDEPTVGADDASAGMILELIRRVRNHGCSVFIISHRYGELESIADRILVLKDGALREAP